MAAPLGNQNAKKGRMWALAIEREVARLEGGDLEAGLARIARRLVRIADEGEDDKSQWALKEIGDRMDGKPHQSSDMTVDAGAGILGVLASFKPK